MTLHFTLTLNSNTHCIAKYIDSEMPSDSISEHLFFKFSWGACLKTPYSISMLPMLIVLRTIIHDHSCTMKFSFAIGLCGLTTGSELCSCIILGECTALWDEPNELSIQHYVYIFMQYVDSKLA